MKRILLMGNFLFGQLSILLIQGLCNVLLESEPLINHRIYSGLCIFYLLESWRIKCPYKTFIYVSGHLSWRHVLIPLYILVCCIVEQNIILLHKIKHKFTYLLSSFNNRFKYCKLGRMGVALLSDNSKFKCRSVQPEACDDHGVYYYAYRPED